MGLILASVGLATFVVGMGIYLFPRQNRFAIAAVTAPKQPAPEEREALAWSKTPILRWTREADGTIYAHSLGFVGKNVGDADIQIDDIYIVSRVTDARIDLKVQIGNDAGVAAQDTNPIPPDAYIQLSSDEFNPSVGIPEADFLHDWGAIDFVAEYGGQKHRLSFEPTTIAGLFDAQRPRPSPPVVTRRSDGHLTAAASPKADDSDAASAGASSAGASASDAANSDKSASDKSSADKSGVSTADTASTASSTGAASTGVSSTDVSATTAPVQLPDPHAEIQAGRADQPDLHRTGEEASSVH
jgi:hypothetical protein